MKKEAVEISCKGERLARLDELCEFQGELKSLSKADYEKLKSNLLDLGFSEPISIWENNGKKNILNGHQRVRALLSMRKEGYTVPDLVPINTVEAKDEREAKKKVLSLASQFGKVEKDGLYEFMTQNQITMPEIESEFRFPEIDISKFNAEFFYDSEELKDDAIPDPPKNPITKEGDLWILGEHRLICGDSTKPETFDRLIGKESAGLFCTDPPYGIDYSKVKDGIPRIGFKNHTEEWGNIKGDELRDVELQAFLESVFRSALPKLKNAAWYLWHANLTSAFFAAAAGAADVLLHRQIIWKKPGFVLTRSGMYHWSHEPCYFGWQRGNPPKWLGPKNQRTVWEIGRDENEGHPTQKPVELFAIPIRNHLDKGEIAIEPFAGSGSQLIAAEQLDRKCYAIEIEPKYCDVIVQRWENLTGKKADRRQA